MEAVEPTIFWWHYALMLLAGFAAGVVNTLAGSGSVFTLSVLLFAGLPANVANGTNRVGVILQNIVGVASFRKAGYLQKSDTHTFVIPSLLGALVGAWVAADIDKRQLEWVIGSVMLIMLPIIIFDPKKRLKTEQLHERKAGVWSWLTFGAIGFYGGFIQAGVGIFTLFAMIAFARVEMVRANAIKLVMVLVFAVPVLFVFIYFDQVRWGYGTVLALGQMGGAYVASRFAINHPQAGIWIRRLLIVMIIVTVAKMFHLLEW